MYRYIHIDIYTYICIPIIGIYIHIYVSIYPSIHLSIHPSIQISLHLCIMYIYIYIYVCVSAVVRVLDEERRLQPALHGLDGVDPGL